jgi:hypothetical protein
MSDSRDVRLSSSVTVGIYRKLELLEERKELGKFVRERFEERYFRPALCVPRSIKHGFSLMAIGCLVVETLEAFYQGVPNTNRRSRRMFEDFFHRDSPFNVFSSRDNWFYFDIRCAILHQAEVRNGWRIRRDGALLDSDEKIINANRFLVEMRLLVMAYSEQLEQDEVLWRNFRMKMKAICENCER